MNMQRRFSRTSRSHRAALLLTSALALGAVVACGTSGATRSSSSPFHDMDAASEMPTSDAGAGLIGFNADATLVSGYDGSAAADAPATTPGQSVFTGPLAGPFSDLSQAPVIDQPDGGTAAPAASADLFGPASQGAATGGPCLLEPELGALYPNNWLRPRFAWVPANASDNLFELRLHVDNQSNDLVVYTANTEWTMPADVWSALRTHSQDVPMTVSVRSGHFDGTTLTGEAAGASGPIGIAPVGAPGTIVYWAILQQNDAGQQTGVLKGFQVGDEGVVGVLAGPQVQLNAAPAGDKACIGCHASTPDGLMVGFGAQWLKPNYSNGLATIGADASPGGVPSFLSAAAATEIGKRRGVPSFSRAHWADGDHIELLSDTGNLLRVDLEGADGGVSQVIPRSLGGDAGDLLGATTPTWSHDGNTIVYTSLSPGNITDGRPNNGPMDLYSVSYADGGGGNATPVLGASQAGQNEFYPSFSPDDALLVFDRIDGNGNVYNSASDELYVIPAAGTGTPTRLSANNPPACSGKSSPGVTNSWAKWSPTAQRVSALKQTYYWLVFSSTRPHVATAGASTTNPQLFITAVTVDDTGKLTTYGSLYLWNQPVTDDNHTPAWDVFQIPPVPMPAVPR
jgi:hypothetical protein